MYIPLTWNVPDVKLCQRNKKYIHVIVNLKSGLKNVEINTFLRTLPPSHILLA